MIVGSKSTLKLNELIDRKQRGVKFIEIQTTFEDFESLEDTLAKKHSIKQNGLQIYAVQVPKENRYRQDCVVGEKNPLWRKENMNLIKKSIILADKLSDNANPTVIIPLGGAVGTEERLADFVKEKKTLFQKDVYELRRYVKEKYPSVILLFKNNPVWEQTKEGRVFFGYGYEDEFIHWIKELKEPQLYICLDIGSALVTARHNKENNNSSDFDSLNYFLYHYAPLMKMIHLSQAHDTTGDRIGFSPDNKEDINVLSQLMSTILSIGYHAPITINPIEENPEQAERFTSTRTCILQSLKKKSP